MNCEHKFVDNGVEEICMNCGLQNNDYYPQMTSSDRGGYHVMKRYTPDNGNKSLFRGTQVEEEDSIYQNRLRALYSNYVGRDNLRARNRRLLVNLLHFLVNFTPPGQNQDNQLKS